MAKNDFKNVQFIFDEFGEDLLEQSRKNLAKLGKNATKRLSNSIEWSTLVTKNAIEFIFFAEDYWQFVDFGVEGVGGIKADGTRWKKRRVVGSSFQREGFIPRFKYKKKRPPARVFDAWQVRKGLAPRGPGGQFLRRSGINYAIAESVYRKGLETTNFFTNPFEQLFALLPEDIIEAYGLDVERTLQQAIDNQ